MPCSFPLGLDQRTFSGGEPGVASYPFGGPVNLPRSKSAQTLKMLNETGNIDEHVVTLSQLLWIAISMLESDYEHEFLLALKLLEKVTKSSSLTSILLSFAIALVVGFIHTRKARMSRAIE